jgi:hypothetical protein
MGCPDWSNRLWQAGEFGAEELEGAVARPES